VWATLYENIALAILQVLLGKCVLLGNESLCLIQGLFPTSIGLCYSKVLAPDMSTSQPESKGLAETVSSSNDLRSIAAGK